MASVQKLIERLEAKDASSATAANGRIAFARW